MPAAPAEFDLFISYAHSDDVSGIVAALHDALEADFRRHFDRGLSLFLDRSAIRDFDDWKVRCHRALRASRFFIVLLSPAYLASDACRWEWEEWIKRELERGQVGVGAACLWFIEVASLDAPGDAERLREWKNELRQRFGVAFHAWREGGREALQDTAARAELARLTDHVAQRLRLLALDRGQRGNLGWPHDRFVGREPELRLLRERLLDAAPSAPVALIGIGGIGKTALALTFAFREADAFPGGRWLLRCEGRAHLDSALRTLVTDLGIELTDDEKLDDTLASRRVLDTLRPRGPALFLLDNVDAPALLAPDQFSLLSGESGIRILLTTRLAPDAFTAAGTTVIEIDLDQLPEDHALALIRLHQLDAAFASTADENTAREIVRALGGLTLAVETAAVYLGQNDPRVGEPRYAVRISDYLEDLRRDIASPGSAMSQLREVAATIRPTLARLDAPARTVLQLAALLHPDAVPLPWLRAIAGKFHPSLTTDAAIAERDEWTDLVRALIGMRLLHPTSEPRVLTIHRLLQRVLDTELREQRDALDVALAEHILARNADLRNTTRWHDARWQVEPLDALAIVWADGNHPCAASLAIEVGRRWNTLAKWSRAEPAMRRGLAIDEASYGPEYVAGHLNSLAELLQATNRFAEAEPLLRRGLAIDEVSFGPEHPNVATHLNNLAQLLLDSNRLAEAEPLMRRALAIDEASFGPEHPEVATDLDNLALLLRATNRLAVAEPLCRRALAINEACLGSNHPKVAKNLSNLAQLLQATSRLAEAEPLMRRALAIEEATFGPEHPEVATDLNNLAHLLQATSRLAEAEPLMRRALAIDEASFGLEHAKVATPLNNLAQLLLATNRLAEAEPLMRRALVIFENNLGSEHPNVASLLNNVANLLQDTNRLAEAEPLYRRALAIKEATFGPEHPNVATDLNNLATLLQDSNRLTEAEPMMRRTVVIVAKFTAATGHKHPHLSIMQGNYRQLLEAMGQSPEEVMERLRGALREGGMNV